MVSTRKMKCQINRLFSRSNDSLKDSVIDNIVIERVVKIEAVDEQPGCCISNFERSAVGENSASHDQINYRIVTDGIKKEVDNNVMAVEKLVHEAFLVAMDNVVTPKVEMVVISFTGSSGRGPHSVVHYPVQRDFSGRMENTPLMAASSQVDSNIDQHRNYETRNVENFEVSNFPPLRPNCDRGSYIHHNDGFYKWHLPK